MVNLKHLFMSTEKLQATNTLSQLASQAGNVTRFVLEYKSNLENEIELLRAVSDQLLAFEQLKNEIDKVLNEKLELATQDLLPDGIFTAGLYKYVKVQKKSASKLDISKLEQIVPDQDNFELCFETVKKPKTQAELSKLFAQIGIDTDVKQLYSQELKIGEFEIKPKN